MSPLEKKKQRLAAQKKIEIQDIYALCTHGYSLNEIAQRVHLSARSTALYIERLLKKGYQIDVSLLVSPEKRQAIEEIVLSTPEGSIKKIIQNNPAGFTEGEIRIVRGFLFGKWNREQGV